MRSTSSAGGFVILDRGRVLPVGDGINHRGILDRAGGVFGVNLLDDLLDAILRGYRLVEDELDLRNAAQREPLGEQVPDEPRRALESFLGLLALGGVADDGPVDARQ